MSSTLSKSATVAFVLKGYPRLSETFIAQEIHALEALGLDILIVSLRQPTDPATHPIHDDIRASVVYLPEYLHWEPVRVLRAWRHARHLPGYVLARDQWRRDLRRDRSRNRIRRFGQALVLGCELAEKIQRLHAHFLHTPASVARYASLLLDIPWSCSAHAKDIWTTPIWEKRDKLAACEWVTTCTRHNAKHLQALSAKPDKIRLNYHGLDLHRFPTATGSHSTRDGRDPQRPVVILSVGRAVDKKGYDDLLRALADLPRSRYWQFVHVGGGDQLPFLKRLAIELKIDDKVTWLGALPQPDILSWYLRADVFALACRVSSNGDRDGLPNVLLEAMSQQVAVLTTAISGIPELIEDQVHGVLVPERDVDAFSRHLDHLICDPYLRARLGEAGCARVRHHFSLEANIAGLAAQFGLTQASAA